MEMQPQEQGSGTKACRDTLDSKKQTKHQADAALEGLFTVFIEYELNIIDMVSC